MTWYLWLLGGFVVGWMLGWGMGIRHTITIYSDIARLEPPPSVPRHRDIGH